MMYSTTNEPTATIHARILSRHEAVQELESKTLESYSLIRHEQHGWKVVFSYYDSENDIQSSKAFDGMHWST